jgi:hypothetical protein
MVSLNSDMNGTSKVKIFPINFDNLPPAMPSINSNTRERYKFKVILIPCHYYHFYLYYISRRSAPA